MNSIVEIFCDVDDFMNSFLPDWQKNLLTFGNFSRLKPSKLTFSEVATIMILFHLSNFRTFKHFYNGYVCKYLCQYFPNLVSYSQFVRLQKMVLLPLCAFLNSKKGTVSGINFIDSTALAVCHNRRIKRHKVFANIAARGKTTMGWFFGFKLHLIVNECGELLSFCVTPGNIDDRKPVKKLAKDLYGKLFGDRGYISKKLAEELLGQNLHLITSVRSTMKNKLLPMLDKVLLRKRFIIETINDQLKNISQIEHSRHRSPFNFMVNLISGLIAYCFQPKKPTLRMSQRDIALIS